MSVFDIVFIILLGWSAVRGFMKGFIIMAASLVALLLGIFGALEFSWMTEDFLQNSLNVTSQYVSVISFATTFILIVVVVHLIAWGLDKLVKAVALGFFNRVLGVVFGIIKMAFIISVLLVIINVINEKAAFISEEQQNDSVLYRPLSDFAPTIFPYLRPERFREYMKGKEEEPAKDDAVAFICLQP
ncbi:MAG: CvpA family protein [Bacteroidota bacterium]